MEKPNIIGKSMSAESKELPEGWEQQNTGFYYRGKACVVRGGPGLWYGIVEDPNGGMIAARKPTAQAAMEALDREYPLAAQHGGLL